MKKLFTLLAIILFAKATMGQVTLTYQTHGLTPEKDNEMILVKHMNPGTPGANIIWDFTKLKTNEDFKGYVTNLSEAPFLGDFPQANIVLNEFGNQFVFQSNETGIIQYGYVSKSGNTKIMYNEPFVKLRFPFNYGDAINGNFDGVYMSGETYKANINGKYEVVADAYGTLLLPNSIKLQNTLRVKTIKKYTQSKDNYSFDVENTTFRWYTANLKYPVLVLIESKYTSNGQTHISHQAAYHDKYVWENTKKDQVNHNSHLAVDRFFPNPVVDNLTIDYSITGETKVKIELFTMEGSKIALLSNELKKAGRHSQEINIGGLGLAAGTYLITIKTDTEETVTEKIIITK